MLMAALDTRQCRQTAEGRWSCAGVSGDILSGDPIMIPALDTSDRAEGRWSCPGVSGDINTALTAAVAVAGAPQSSAPMAGVSQ